MNEYLQVAEDELAFSTSTEGEAAAAKPVWMAQLTELAELWLKTLPKVGR